MTTHSADEAGEPVPGLFEDLVGPREADLARAQERARKRSQGTPRVLEPDRKQIELRASELESLLGEDHRARLAWGYPAPQGQPKHRLVGIEN